LIDTIIFDLFFTLFTLDYSYSDKEYEFYALGISKEEWEIRNNKTYEERALGKNATPYEMMEYILNGLNVPKMKIQKAVEIRKQRIRKGLSTIEARSLDHIRTLKNSGYRVGLISNVDILDKVVLEEFNLEKHFTSVIFSYNERVAKPDKEIYLKMAEKLHTRPERCLFVGDGGSKELFGAKNVGMKTVLTVEYIKDLWKDRIPALMKDADYYIESLQEIYNILEKVSI